MSHADKAAIATARHEWETEETTLGRTVIYCAADGDDTPEMVPYPLCAGIETFAAIIARVHRAGAVDLMVLDPSKGPMPRWKVPYSKEPLAGHWTPRRTR